MRVQCAREFAQRKVSALRVLCAIFVAIAAVNFLSIRGVWVGCGQTTSSCLYGAIRFLSFWVDRLTYMYVILFCKPSCRKPLPSLTILKCILSYLDLVSHSVFCSHGGRPRARCVSLYPWPQNAQTFLKSLQPRYQPSLIQTFTLSMHNIIHERQSKSCRGCCQIFRAVDGLLAADHSV